MASSWIKIEVITPDKPEIFQMAEILNIDPDAVLGKMIRVWAWADQQTIDGNAKGNAASVTRSVLDRVTCVSGFANALIDVGWLAEQDGRLFFPNHERHNGETSKKRALTNSRVSKLRDKKRNSNAECNATSVTGAYQKALPEEEEEKDIKEHPPNPPRGKRVVKKFNALDVALPDWLPAGLWAEWVSFRSALKKPIKTDAGVIGTISKLEKFRLAGYQPADVIRQSIANEWQGLFEPKNSQVTYAANHSASGESTAERQLRAGREQWARERGLTGVAPVGSHDQNLQHPMDNQEWQSSLRPLGETDRGYDE